MTTNLRPDKTFFYMLKSCYIILGSGVNFYCRQYTTYPLTTYLSNTLFWYYVFFILLFALILCKFMQTIVIEQIKQMEKKPKRHFLGATPLLFLLLITLFYTQLFASNSLPFNQCKPLFSFRLWNTFVDFSIVIH